MHHSQPNHKQQNLSESMSLKNAQKERHPEGLSLPSLTNQQGQKLLNLGDEHFCHYLSRWNKLDLEKAIEYFKQAVEIEPYMAKGHIKLAQALWQCGEITVEKALDYCNDISSHNMECKIISDL